MSVTAIVWVLLFAFLAVRTFSRPIYGVFLYLQTFFAAPQFWWWGEPLMALTSRWNIVASLILVAGVAISWSKRRSASVAASKLWNMSVVLLTVYMLNAVVVHIALADYPANSWIALDLVIKQLVLTLLIYFALDSKADLDAFLLGIFIGCVFIGYQVVINEAGSSVNGRLEGIRIPGTSSANGVAAILITGLCVGGYRFLLAKPLLHKAIIATGCVLILETILRCNSRGAFLGLGCAAIWMAVCTKGSSRKQILLGIALGIIAVLLQARNDFIWSRFDTTFAAAEERDGSANERLDYWEAGLKMLSDHPIGSGGEAGFKSPRGMTYITHIRQDQFRGIHNGFLDIAISWGIQGFILLICCISFSLFSVWRLTKSLGKKLVAPTLLGATIQAIMISQLVTAMFLSRLDHEVFNWLIVACSVYYREYSTNASAYFSCPQSHEFASTAAIVSQQEFATQTTTAK